MPILHVRALPQKDPTRIQPALIAACRAIAEAGGYEPHHVWGTWEELPPGRYVEGVNPASQQPTETHPPIVSLMAFEGCEPAEIEAMLTAAARALSETLGIPGNIFIHYSEAKSGQVIAGDGIVRRS
jgi:hypothetical protein